MANHSINTMLASTNLCVFYVVIYYRLKFFCNKTFWWGGFCMDVLRDTCMTRVSVLYFLSKRKPKRYVICFQNILYKNALKTLNSLTRAFASRVKSRISLKKILESHAITIIKYHSIVE